MQNQNQGKQNHLNETKSQMWTTEYCILWVRVS